MPKLLHTSPSYRHHKPSGQAVVTLNGLDHYLGPWKSKASKAEYDRLIREWLNRFFHKQLAEETVRRVEGVKRVVNQIEIVGRAI